MPLPLIMLSITSIINTIHIIIGESELIRRNLYTSMRYHLGTTDQPASPTYHNTDNPHTFPQRTDLPVTPRITMVLAASLVLHVHAQSPSVDDLALASLAPGQRLGWLWALKNSFSLPVDVTHSSESLICIKAVPHRATR
jgi:hypothetical protein